MERRRPEGEGIDMTVDTGGPVVVGVDGSPDAQLALRFAVREAARERRRLLVVHAVHDGTAMTPAMVHIAGETATVAGRRIADVAAKEAQVLSDVSLRVDTLVQQGPRARVLIEAAPDAHLLVLGHRELRPPRRVLTHSTAMSVAARADCPVVCVPAEWRPEVTQGSVVVGVDGSEAAQEALRVAFSAASTRGAALRVVHAWRLPYQYEGVLDSAATAAEFNEQAKVLLAEAVAGWSEQFPEVDVRLESRYQRPADALAEISADADLVVIGRHGHGAGFGLRLGSVARAMIHATRAPLEITPVR